MVIYSRNSILATIIYYDIFDFPLTLLEISKYLISQKRFHLINDSPHINLSDIRDEIDKLVSAGFIGHKNGFYFLSGREGLYDLRMKRDKIASQKWKKFLKIIKFLSLAPYLRGVFASGSMAINNTDDKSDFDVMIITKFRRLYTCRFFLWLISSILGARRKKNEKVAPNKLCFNHYITDDSLYIPHISIFNAQTYINLKPVMIDNELIDRFYLSNQWLDDFIYNFQPQKEFVRRSVIPNRFFKILAKAGEIILNSFIGNWLELALKRYQQSLIIKNPATYEAGGRVIFSDTELEFHPHSFEKVVIEKYKKGLRKMGIVSIIEEHDSGLN